MCKDKDGEISNFNISVSITNDFMHKVKNDEDFNLISPYTKTVTKIVKASYLWDLLMTQAHKNGEPGVLFLDTVNKYNPIPSIKLKATNPCVTGDTLILTDNGNVRIDSIVGEKVNVWNGKEFSEVTPTITGINQNVIKFELSNGLSITTTVS